MQTDEISAEIEKDSKLDINNLSEESIRIPYLHSKWYHVYVEEFRKYKAREAHFAQLKLSRIEYYLGRSEDDVYIDEPLNRRVLKQELDVYLDADRKMIEAKLKLAEAKMRVDMVEAFIKTINNRSFQIRNAIEFLKFKSGG